MPAPVLSGPQYLREGLKLVLSPGLRLFVLLPLAINLVLFVGLIYLAGHQFSLWVDTLMPSLPDWLSFLSYILWPLFVVLVALMVFFTFTMLANVIAAPFNGFLAEKVEVVVRGTDDFPAFSWGELIAMVPRTLAREMRKLGYFLPRAIGLFILSFIPVVNIIAAPLWLLFGVWMMAIQYIDYPADNHKLGWNEMLAWLRQKRWQSMSFGGIVYLVLLIPVVNILMMPAAVAGATLFWVRERGAENLVTQRWAADHTRVTNPSSERHKHDMASVDTEVMTTALHITLISETFPPEINGVANTLGRLCDGLRAATRSNWCARGRLAIRSAVKMKRCCCVGAGRCRGIRGCNGASRRCINCCGAGSVSARMCCTSPRKARSGCRRCGRRGVWGFRWSAGSTPTFSNTPVSTVWAC